MPISTAKQGRHAIRGIPVFSCLGLPSLSEEIFDLRTDERHILVILDALAPEILGADLDIADGRCDIRFIVRFLMLRGLLLVAIFAVVLLAHTEEAVKFDFVGIALEV